MKEESTVYFEHATTIWQEFPTLSVGVIHARGVRAVDTSPEQQRFLDDADRLLSEGPEGEAAPIQAWRRTFSAMGFKPTQYRCASESLLRRYRKETSLPSIHGLVDLCNAASVAFAIPIAVFDVDKVHGGIQVRHATGRERYLSFAQEVEHPEPGEVVFVDEDDNAHARRWTHRQSALSAISPSTVEALIVAEAHHASAPGDLDELLRRLTEAIHDSAVSAHSESDRLSANQPRWDLKGVTR
jgi:DNA/RNA-binding domain of Phe-tRNA-synthetase-like protein